MIRISRPDLDAELSLRLRARTDQLKVADADHRAARRVWSGAALEKEGIRLALRLMSAAVERCMYCGDSRGTDIDHFEPIKLAPLRTFEWLNHLLACSSCNSNAKRDRFPVDESGTCLLVDPTRDDPLDHLRLILSTGTYRGNTPRGCTTIEVFQLNRADLRRGRELAFPRCQAMLREYLRLRNAGDRRDAAVMLNALREQPFLDVLYAMYRTMPVPGADVVLGGPEVLDALRLSMA
ncbi:HNH endonuclease [Nonomuraea sp. SBT364]|uniref:HNH endonuclease n=1 Tax=Nonomuraea sp. SBT364 TaxID=1580530 RepID=UPI000B25FC7D|nr:HNH endonuclease [Nonomuraea sp. SBT364]